MVINIIVNVNVVSLTLVLMFHIILVQYYTITHQSCFT